MMLFMTSGEPETETKETAAAEAEASSAGLTEEQQLQEDYRRFGIEGDDEESMDSIADVLSTFQDDAEEAGDAKPEKADKRSDISKKQRLIPILAVCAVVGLVLYYFVLAPMLESITEEEIPPINTWLTEQLNAGAITELEYNDLLNKGKCEVLGSQNRILMFNHTEKANIQSVEVHNTHGTYTFYRDSSDNFVIKDAETASYDKEMLSSLVVSSGYTLSMTRVSENCEDLSEYGLAPEDNPSYYTLTTTEGVTHTVYIGKAIPTGAGFYCSYEDRPAVYVLDSTLASTLLADVRDLMTAILTYPVTSTYYYTITNFDMTKNGEDFLHVDYLTDAERVQTASTSVWRMVYPEGGYTPSSTNYDAMLQSFTTFTGNRVLEYNVLGDLETEEMTEEQVAIFEQYDLAQPETTISFDYTDPDAGYTVTNMVWFSSMTEEGQYYVYSWLFDVVSVIDAATYPWLSYDIIDFIDRPVFQMNINNVAKIEISGGEAGEEPLTADFRLVGDGQELVVTEEMTGTVVDTQNFRQLYKTMLSVEIEDYTEDTTVDESKCIATMRITTEADIVTEYKFYAYSTRRCFMTINGEGEFYVLRDMAAKLVSDAKKVIAGVTVNSDARS
ncbi:MAG: DUF4340 domain-containing protein [Clostridia bacterium]|nr:DUF4340 domain-containing protein [Clostridia bacterium]